MKLNWTLNRHLLIFAKDAESLFFPLKIYNILITEVLMQYSEKKNHDTGLYWQKNEMKL